MLPFATRGQIVLRKEGANLRINPRPLFRCKPAHASRPAPSPIDAAPWPSPVQTANVAHACKAPWGPHRRESSKPEAAPRAQTAAAKRAWPLPTRSARLPSHCTAYVFRFGPSSRSATSVIPYQFTIAATFGSGAPGHCRSKPALSGIIPVISARCPPAESPEVTSRAKSK